MAAEDIDASVLVDCLDDWMEETFSVEADERSHHEIAAAIMRVREELAFCATNDLDVANGSLTLQQLHTFNENNRSNISAMNQHYKAQYGER